MDDASFFWYQEGEKNVSRFLLQFVFVFQIIPFTIIYEMQDEKTTYYSFVCLAFAICEWVVATIPDVKILFRIRRGQGKSTIHFFGIILISFLAYVYHKNGLPTITALNMLEVYELRESGIYQVGKYGMYVQETLKNTIVQILLTDFYLKKSISLCSLYLEEIF